jgi:hypothetical protein
MCKNNKCGKKNNCAKRSQKCYVKKDVYVNVCKCHCPEPNYQDAMSKCGSNGCCIVNTKPGNSKAKYVAKYNLLGDRCCCC